MREEYEAEVAAVHEEVTRVQGELEYERRANEHLSSLVSTLKTGDLATVYVEGTRDLAGAAEFYEEAKSEGMVNAAKIFAPL